jgi:hypothetical protein
MTRDQLPEKLRNMPGFELFDPTQGKRKIVLSESKTAELAKVIAPLLDKQDAS